MRVAYIGHATVVLELDGVRLLTDPVLRRRVGHLRRATIAAPAGDVDAILISHGHYDHLDQATLRRFDPRIPVVVPRGLGLVLRRFERVVELAEGEETDVGTVRVRATHAEHSGSRPPWRFRSSALGYAILGSQRAFFAGDTDLFDAMDGLVADLDLALLPVAGWGPRLPRGHFDPLRAAEALNLLRPRVAVPIHWGTFLLLHRRARLDVLRRPADEFAKRAATIAPDVEVRILAPGESFELAQRSSARR